MAADGATGKDRDTGKGGATGKELKLDLAGPLLMVGAGKMGGAMLAGWLENGLDPAAVTILDPGPPPDVAVLLEKYGITPLPEVAAVDITPALIVMAVKPQMMDQVFPPVARLAAADTLILSIAAGRLIASFEKHLQAGAPVVRTMPNTPAAIGRGISVCCGNRHVTERQREICTALLRGIGVVEWVDDEALIEVVTGVSGAGPAYVFALTESLARAGVEAGLEEALAMRLARATVAGAGELLHRDDESAAILRRNVTSPAGATAAALEILLPGLPHPDKSDRPAPVDIKAGLPALMTHAVAAAIKRARELSS